MTTIISRRGFLRIGCCAAAQLGIGSMVGKLGLAGALAQSAPGYQALVCVFLFGGNDANNTIVPADTRYNQYQSIRGSLALAENTMLPIAAVDGTPYGLHPSLPEVQGLYQNKAAAFVINVGTLVEPTTRTQYQSQSVPVPGNLFSHSDQQLQWQSSIPSTFGSTTGWGGRITDALRSEGVSPGSLPAGVSVAGNSLFLTGANTIPATVIPAAPLGLAGGSGSAAMARNAALQSLLGFDTGFALVQAANQSMSSGLQIAAVLNKAFTGVPPLGVTFPATQLGAQMQQVSQIIQVRQQLGATRQVFFCSLGGFDTHFNELSIQLDLLQQLSQALDAFYAATVKLGVSANVTTFTASDFNRTFQQNATGGSDHAWGSHHLVVGDGVKGGDIYGTFPDFVLNAGDDANNRGVWIPTISTDQYGATLASWLGVTATDVSAIFGDLKNFPSNQNLGFMK